MTTTTVDEVAIAREFSRVLREWLTPEEVAEANRRNAARDAADPCCSSHDFCDANMAMEAAHERLHATTPAAAWSDGSDDAAHERLCERWNAAWKLAKSAQFDPEKIR